ncbi:MAG: serine protease [Verrucomicrobia bacterium]|nr:serine protease [Verrucomicrobiota bacterium]
MSLDVTILGSINNSGRGDVDLYRVPAKAGERLSVEVDCVRLSDVYAGAAAACDLALRVIDAAGRELAANDENPLHVQDPLLSLKLPAGIGDHVFVEVRRSIFDRNVAPYALHLGRFERPLAVYPSGGPPGEKLSVTLLGDPLGDRRTEIAVPNPTGTFQPFGDVPSGLPMRSFAAPNVLEAAASETPVPHIPAALNGILARPGEMDRFRVKVKKGDRLRLRVYAATLGSPLDPVLNIRKDGEPQPEISGDDASGRGLADRDIRGPTPRSGTCLKDTFDPSLLWEPKSDGDYLIEIGANGGEGPAGVYRVEVMPPPDAVFSLLQARDRSTWSEHVGYTGLAVPKGNRWTVNVSLPFGQGTMFKGDMEIVASGLPPGVTLGNTRISGAEHAARSAASPYGLADWPVELIAGPDSRPGGAVITLDVRSTDPAKKIETASMQWFPFLNSSGGDAWRAVKTERFIMAVTDPAPFSIELQAPAVPLVRGGEMAIPVKLTRRVGFDEPIDFVCDNAPVGVSYQPAETLPGDRGESVLRLTADTNARLGGGPLSVVAFTRRDNNPHANHGGAGEIRVSAPIILINVAEPYLALGSEPASVRRGGGIPYRWTVTPKTPFEGEAEVKLLGLPKGVTVREPFPRITAASKEVVFQIAATEEALLGPVNNLECEVIVHAAGQEIRQRTGKGILRIDPKL